MRSGNVQRLTDPGLEGRVCLLLMLRTECRRLSTATRAGCGYTNDEDVSEEERSGSEVSDGTGSSILQVTWFGNDPRSGHFTFLGLVQ